MESVNQKLQDIKIKFFKNLFDQEFINDAYDFLESIKFFHKVEENKNSLFGNNNFKKFQNEEIYHQIKEIYHHHNSKKIENIIKIGLLDKIKTKVEKIEIKENKYSFLFDQILKQRHDEELKEKEFIVKCEQVLQIYEKEEVIEFIHQDEKIKNKIISNKGDTFKTQINFEEDLIKFFISSCENTKDFEKLNNKDYIMSFRRETHGITLKFEKELNISIINLISLIYEVDNYPKWFPFCSKSETICQPGKAKKLVYLVCNFPVISDRDFLIYGIGINRLRENNSIMILCRSVGEKSGIFKDQMHKKNNKKFVRAEILIFGFEIKIINKNKCLVKGLVNTDPKIGFIPEFLINLVSQKFAGDLFTKLIEISKIYEGSEYQNKNPSKIDKLFYDYIAEEIKHI